MNKSTKYLENVAIVDTDDFGNIIESISMSDATTACDIRELEVLEKIKDNNLHLIDHRISELSKKLKNIKL